MKKGDELIYTEYGEKYDIEYQILVPLMGLNFIKMTPAQAQENFDWFLSKIPERMEYLRQRCATDLKISESDLDFSPESLKLVWRWFIDIARIVPTQPEELKRLEAGAKIFGASFINKYQFSVASQFIMRDIGMYLGEVFVRNYPQLYWSYYTKPKNVQGVNEPLVFGFVVPTEGNIGGAFQFNPMVGPRIQGSRLLTGTQDEQDLLNVFWTWEKYIPGAEE